MRIQKGATALVGVLAMVAAAACGDSGPESPAGPTTPSGCGLEEVAEERDTPVEVTMWHYLPSLPGGTASPAFAELVDRFNASQSKVKVTVKGFASGHELVRRYYAIPPGDPAAPDIVQLPPPATRAAVDTDRVIAVQACVDAAGTDLSPFLPGGLADTRADGVQWGLPDGYQSDLLLYDRAAFERAGLDPDHPPATVAELRTAAERLRAAGVAHPIARLEAFTLLESATVQVVVHDDGRGNRTGRAGFDSEDAQEVVTAVAAMRDEGLIAPPGPESQFYGDLLAVGRGESAITQHNAMGLKVISRALAEGQAPGFRLGIAPLPSVHGPARSCFMSGSLLLSAGPSLARRGAAWTFLDWFEAPAQQAAWHVTSPLFPTRRDAVADPTVSSLWAAQPELAAGWTALTSTTCPDPPFFGPQAQLGQAIGD
ncbi:MAG TPA: extracellular solute-binding protein, partial [Acidimicrobiales bacterium]